MTTANATRELVETGLANLRRLKDEVALEVHLGTMEARDKWEQFQHKFTEVEREWQKNVTETTDSVLTSVAAKITELEEQLKSQFAKKR